MNRLAEAGYRLESVTPGLLVVMVKDSSKETAVNPLKYRLVAALKASSLERPANAATLISPKKDYRVLTTLREKVCNNSSTKPSPTNTN